MHRCLSVVIATFAVVVTGMLVSERAEAGGSQSAPSKYPHVQQTIAASMIGVGWGTRNKRNEISEFSSSSANPASPPKNGAMTGRTFTRPR